MGDLRINTTVHQTCQQKSTTQQLTQRVYMTKRALSCLAALLRQSTDDEVTIGHEVHKRYYQPGRLSTLFLSSPKTYSCMQRSTRRLNIDLPHQKFVSVAMRH